MYTEFWLEYLMERDHFGPLDHFVTD